MKIFLNSVLRGNSWPIFIVVMWLFCSRLIVSNSFTSAERRFYLKSIQRFGSTSWTTVLTKCLLNLPIIDFLIYYSWNTLSFTAKHVASFVVHCVLFAIMTYIFNMRYKRIQFLFIFLSNYLISHFPFSAGSSVSSCERPFLNPGTYLFCKVSVLFLNIQGERTVAIVIHKGSLWKTAPMSICGPMSSWWWHADRARFLFELQLCSC